MAKVLPWGMFDHIRMAAFTLNKPKHIRNVKNSSLELDAKTTMTIKGFKTTARFVAGSQS